MRAILYVRPDGGVSIVHPQRHAVHDAKMTDAQVEARAMDVLQRDRTNPATAAYGATGITWIDPAALPADRTFRNAWKASGSAVAHDMDKVAEIARERCAARPKHERDALHVAIEEACKTGNIAAVKAALEGNG